MRFADLIESIDALEADEIGELVDWQLARFPAARAEEDFTRRRNVVVHDEDGAVLWSGHLWFESAPPEPDDAGRLPLRWDGRRVWATEIDC